MRLSRIENMLRSSATLAPLHNMAGASLLAALSLFALPSPAVAPNPPQKYSWERNEALSILPAQSEIDVSVKKHPELKGDDYVKPSWISDADYPIKQLPKPAWNKDGSLSVWHVAAATGSFSIAESGAQALLLGKQLSLCYAWHRKSYAPNEPVAAYVVPVVIEFRIRNLPPGEYSFNEIQVCR